MKVLYRVFEVRAWASEDEPRADVLIEAHRVIKETSHGDWIMYNGKKKFVLCSHWGGVPSRKRWAYPTKEEAVASFVQRKRHHISHLESRLNIARSALHKALQPGFEPEKFGEYFTFEVK
jgi:hypothetical protein